MSPSTSIYVVEDDPEISSLLADFLSREGFRVETVENSDGLERLIRRSGPPDLLVLDWMLPGENGLTICRRMREAGSIPIIMLTAKDEEIDRILGLEMGADDYIPKPFNPRELLARIRAVLRRTTGDLRELKSRQLVFADFVIDLDGRTVTTGEDGPELSLTSAEFELLKCFVTRPQRVLSRDQLLDWTRGRVADVFDRSIDVQVSRLRRKLENGDTGPSQLIKTVRNVGYIFTAPVRQI